MSVPWTDSAHDYDTPSLAAGVGLNAPRSASALKVRVNRMATELIVDRGAIRHELSAKGGTVDKYVALNMARTVQRARRRVPVVTGQLSRSIGWRNISRGTTSSQWAIEANAAHASWIHTGRRYSPTAGRIITARAGARPFLTEAVNAEFG